MPLKFGFLVQLYNFLYTYSTCNQYTHEEKSVVRLQRIFTISIKRKEFLVKLDELKKNLALSHWFLIRFDDFFYCAIGIRMNVISFAGLVVAFGYLTCAQFSIADYCACVKFDKANCTCGPLENDDSGAVIIYCNGGEKATDFPKIIINRNSDSCRLLHKCDIAIVFEHYRASKIPDHVIADLLPHQPCTVRFAHRHNPALNEISQNAFTTNITAKLKQLHIEYTGLPYFLQ